MRDWIPLVSLGNPLPLGAGLFVDDSGQLRHASVRGLLLVRPGPPTPRPFAVVLVEELARWHDDDARDD